MDSYALLQGIFPTQGLNPCLLHCRQVLCHLSHQRSLKIAFAGPDESEIERTGGHDEEGRGRDEEGRVSDCHGSGERDLFLWRSLSRNFRIMVSDLMLA